MQEDRNRERVELLTFSASSSKSLNLSYSRLLAALYTWNSPLPAPALEPCTFFIISLGALILFSFGGGGIYTGFAGSLRSRSSWDRCFSTAVNACLCPAVPAAGVEAPEPDALGVPLLDCGCDIVDRVWGYLGWNGDGEDGGRGQVASAVPPH